MLEPLSETMRVELARVLLVLLAFGVIWLLRNLVAWLIAQPLRRLLARAGRAELDGMIRSIVLSATGYLLLALAIDIGARILEVDASVMSFIVHVTRMLVIVAVAQVIFRLVDILVVSRGRLYLLTGLAVDEALLPFLRTGTQLVILALALVIIIQEWGYDVSGLIAGLGLGGLAISLAAQETLSNIFGFAAIVSDRPFVVGEYIKTKDVEGIIEKVGLRSTRVRQLDQAVVSVPNSLLASTSILNWSRLARRQVNLTLGVTYATNPEQMQLLLDRLRTMLAARETVDPDSVIVYFVNFGSSSLDVLVRCYVSLSDWKEFTAEKERILLEIMRIVETVGLEIAFPSQSLYIQNLGSGLNLSEQPLAQPIPNELPKNNP
jgi:MscS family membrane protein